MKPRNAILLQMILTRKGGVMRDRKAESKRRACRGRVRRDDEG